MAEHRKGPIPVKASTVANWIKELDPEGEWIVHNGAGSSQKISCKLCKKFEASIKYLHNFNRAFIEGVQGNK